MHFTRRQFAIASGALCGSTGLTSLRRVSAEDPQPTQPVVVELFTSQGCNSCPPADRVLRDLVDKHEQDAFPVLCLSFHVDYWNYLGWKDPFSSPKWSMRQRAYAKVLDGRVYTPQIILNGREGFVGSRRAQLEVTLPKYLQATAEHSIELSIRPHDANQLKIDYTVGGNLEGCLLNLAIVSRSLTAKADRGENAGRTLSHANVVRDFSVNRLEERQGTARLRLPPDEGTKQSVIGYVQNTQQAMITAAIEQSIS